jgi:AcrR family transcriptional regulator
MNERSFISISGQAMAEKKTEKGATPRQERILKAALEVFSRKGYAAATIPEIARAAGVATGTIYIYYPSKRELFIAVIQNFIITVPLLDLIDKIPEADIAVTFRQILKNRLGLIESQPVARIPSLMGDIQRDPELKTLWAEQFLQPFFARVEGVYRAMMASGKFRRIEPSIATRAIGGMILGFLMLKLMEGESSPLNRLPQDEVADALADFVAHGLMNDAGE